MADEAKDIVLRGNQFSFKYRTTGIFINAKGNIAINVDPVTQQASLPGGKVKYGETSREAIEREFIEEVGIHVRAIRLIAVIENLFNIDDQQYNEIMFTWLIERVDQEQVFAKDSWEQCVTWRKISELPDIKPKILQTVLRDLPTIPVHLINRD